MKTLIRAGLIIIMGAFSVALGVLIGFVLALLFGSHGDIASVFFGALK